MKKSVCKSSYQSTKSHKTGKPDGPNGTKFELLKVSNIGSVKKLVEVADDLLQGRDT